MKNRSSLSSERAFAMLPREAQGRDDRRSSNWNLDKIPRMENSLTRQIDTDIPVMQAFRRCYTHLYAHTFVYVYKAMRFAITSMELLCKIFSYYFSNKKKPPFPLSL